MHEVQQNPQLGLYETTIEDEELEQLLVRRAAAKQKAAAARKTASAIDEEVRERVERLDLADAPVRIGEFVVSWREVPASPIAFERAASRRLVIRPLDA